MSTSAIPVTMSGFSWGSALLLVLNLLVGGVFVAIVRTRPALKKIAADREANLLTERAADMEAMRKRIATLEAEQRVDRHAMGNLEQCLDSLLLMIELNPDKAREAAVKVKEMRARHKMIVAAEKGAIHATNIAGAEQ